MQLTAGKIVAGAALVGALGLAGAGVAGAQSQPDDPDPSPSTTVEEPGADDSTTDGEGRDRENCPERDGADAEASST